MPSPPTSKKLPPSPRETVSRVGERLATARSGAVIAYRDDAALHSAYDPVAEARRFVAASGVDASVRTIFLVAPCLGYLLPPLREAAPDARILTIQCSPFFSEDVAIFPSDACWTPADSLDLASFLEREASDVQALRSRIVEWRPASLAYGRRAVEYASAIRDFVATARANEETVAAFGRRWIRNAFRFLRAVERPCALERGNAPIVVVGSGPSLEKTAGVLREAREEGRCSVFAAASALPALFAAGVRVDLAISSDGGAWARYHLMEATRRGVCVAATLVSAFPSNLSAFPSIALADLSPWQDTLMQAAGIPAFRSPQRGTVTATSLDLALASTSGSVYLAGLDLASLDLRTHARPNALDRFREDATDRLHPEYSYAFDRRGTVSTAAALDLYSRWFASKLSCFKDRVAALGPIHPSLAFLPMQKNIAEAVGAVAPRLVEYGPGIGGGERASLAAATLLRELETERDSLRESRSGAAGKLGKLGESLIELLTPYDRRPAKGGYDLVVSFISSIARNGSHG